MLAGQLLQQKVLLIYITEYRMPTKEPLIKLFFNKVLFKFTINSRISLHVLKNIALAILKLF